MSDNEIEKKIGIQKDLKEKRTIKITRIKFKKKREREEIFLSKY